MVKNKLNLSIIIPILNEANNLEQLVYKIKKNLKKINFELIFVDDNSFDNTQKILKKLKKDNKFLRYFIRKGKRDLSSSCILGFERCHSENIAVMDGDLQHDPKYLLKMYNIFINKQFDFVIGARNFKNYPIPGLSFTRFLASKLLIYLFFLLVGKKTSDPMSGFFVFNKKIFIINKKKLFGKGYKILSDLLYSSNEKIKVKDYYIKFNLRNKGKSKMNIKVLLNLIIFIFFNFFRNF